MRRTTDPALLVALLLSAGTAAAQPHVTLEPLIVTGDPLPNGYVFQSTSYATFDLDGEAICFPVYSAEGYAICTMDLATREITVIADMSTISPTNGQPFQRYQNPAIADGRVFVTGSSVRLHPEGVYAGVGGPVQALTDIAEPSVLIPRAVETDGVSLVFRDDGYAGEALAWVPAAGGASPNYFAYRGRSAPGGGELFNVEEIFGVDGDRIVFSALRSNGASGYAIYSWPPNGPDELTTLVQTGDAVPDGHILAAVREPVPSGPDTAFVGTDGGFPYFDGVYIHRADGAIEAVVDDNTPFPGHNVTFDSFWGLSLHGDNVLFVGLYGEATYAGSFLRHNGELLKIVELGDVVDGKAVYSMSHRSRALHGNKAVIALTMDDFASFGIYLATVNDACPPDFTGDGALDLFDFLAFVNAFNAQDPHADFDHNGISDLFDFLAFVNAFNAGC